MLLMIDNYDSFTFNLVQYFGELGEDVRVVRNDELTVADIGAMKPDRLVLSPGPCSPAEAGVCVEAIRTYIGQLPILGVCLGHQAIGAAFGARVLRGEPMHGRATAIHHDGTDLFADLPQPLFACRYHSLYVADPLPPELVATARTERGEVMALRHREHPTFGVQFHPESFRTPDGPHLLANFLLTMQRGQLA